MCQGSSPPAAAVRQRPSQPSSPSGRSLGPSGTPQGPLRDPPGSQCSDGLGSDAATQGQAEVSDGQDNFGTGHGGHLHQL